MPILNPGQGSGSAAIPSVKVLPDGYEYRKNVNGDLQLYKVDVTPEVLITSANVGEFDVNGSLRAAINTIYLEDAHSIKSSGEEVVFKNLESNVFYTPLWQFTSEDGESVGEASVLVEEPTSTEYFQNGTVVTPSTSVACVDTYTTTANGSVYQFIAESAQNYSGKLSLELRNSLGNAVFRLDKVVNLSVGNSIVFDKLLYRVRVGNVRTFSLVKEDGTPLQVRGGLDQTKPWVKVVYRGFFDRKIVHVDSSGKIPTSDLPQIDTVERNTVANQAARLALPVSTKFRITIQTDIQRQFYLDPNANPSVLANWVDGGSVASTVTSAFGRTGNVTAQTGDYTAAQVGAVASPASDGARRVLIGNIPTLENIVNDLTTDSSSVPLSAAQGKLLKDTKQDNITGGATSILSSNLTASRALSSDVNGKVIASSVTGSELGQLSGVTGNIQTQLDGKQSTITGTASTITNSELIADRVMITDSNKKASASTVTATELGTLSGVTSSVQVQIDSKQSTITGAASTVVSSNLNPLSVVVTDVNGKLIADPNVTTTEVGYLDGVTSSIQTQLNGKQQTLTGAATTIANSNLTTDRVIVSDGAGKVSASNTTSTEVGYLSGVTSSIQTQLDGKQATVTGTASTIVSTNLTGSRVMVTNPGGKASASSVTTTQLDYLSGVTSAIQTQLNGKQATITGAATTITSSNLTASRVLVSDGSGKVAADANIDTTELSYLNGVSKNIQTQVSDGWFARNTANTLTGDKFSIGYTPIATGSGTVTLAMIPWSMPTTTNGRAWQFAWMLNQVGAMIGSLDNDRSYDGLYSTLLTSAASDATLMKTAWPVLGSIDVDQAPSASPPSEAFKMILGRDASSIYWVNVVGWFNAADDRGIRYETSSNVWSNAQDGTAPLIRSSSQLTAGAATFSDALISSSWPALCVIPTRLELY